MSLAFPDRCNAAIFHRKAVKYRADGAHNMQVCRGQREPFLSALEQSYRTHPTGGIGFAISPLMRLRITTRPEKRATVIHVDGELLAEGVPELYKACRSAEGRIRLDLSNLRSADAFGIETLRAFAEKGMDLVGASTYIEQLLARGS